ncbi:MAG: hypothetical protein US63_C0002G0007 [Candidatus Moranbacteria bacterium GW2011_GWC2_37_8]|nr:MAG: hypothetical protein US63_C0002G0007 [Candidatus Moranbacteria bacterium GW2011_GWC2_37_8]KKQ62717.1 MAG: hypothetical protein US82_C0007G0007 [Parcubacteria group bacterium GW2011_GWC1_38_22]
MNFPELSLFVFYFVIGSYEGFILAIAFIILMFKLKRESENYRLLSMLTFCGYIAGSLLEVPLLPYIKAFVIHALGPMSDWIRGVNNCQVMFTGTISTAIITVILGLKKMRYF